MAESPVKGAVQKYQGDRQYLSGRLKTPAALAGWFVDGTLAFMVQESDQESPGLEERLAASYQKQFKHSPEFVAAMDRAFKGEIVTQMVQVQGRPWDVRLFPVSRGDGSVNVTGLLTDARNRITAARSFSTIELLSQIGRVLARSDSVDQFLHDCCVAIERLCPAVWIGVADRGEDRVLKILTGEGEASRQFAALKLSWDLGRKGGRHPAADAVNSGSVKIVHDLAKCSDTDLWTGENSPWTTLIAVPLWANGAALGVLVVHGDAQSDADAEMSRLWQEIAADITEGMELLRAKEERGRILRERGSAYEQYEQLLNTVFDIIIVHRAGRVLEINPAGVKLLGADNAEQIIGTQVRMLIDPADRKFMRDTLEESNSAGELREFRLLSLDGDRTIDVEGLTVSVMRHGAPARLSHWRDITARKRTEKLMHQQKTSLEYAQQVAKCGSVELDVTTGRVEWSKNALTILSLEDAAGGGDFMEALSSVVTDQDRPAVAGFVADICQHGKEFSCDVTLKSDAPVSRVIHLHGIPHIEQHTRVTRIFVVVQDISRHRNTERELQSRLTETWNLARFSGWTYDVEQDKISWDGNLIDFLGFESHMPHVTFGQYLAYIRPQDRELARRSIERSIKSGVGGEMIYEARFERNVTLRILGRWITEKNAAGKVVRLRGLSIDVSNFRYSHESETQARIHVATGLPEKAMIFERVQYLGIRAGQSGKPFTLIGLRIHNYPDLKRHMANDDLYYKTQNRIGCDVMRAIEGADTFGRLEHGRFVLLLTRAATREDIDTLKRLVTEGWRDGLIESDSSRVDPVQVDTASIEFPQEGIAWENLFTLMEQTFTS